MQPATPFRGQPLSELVLARMCVATMPAMTLPVGFCNPHIFNELIRVVPVLAVHLDCEQLDPSGPGRSRISCFGCHSWVTLPVAARSSSTTVATSEFQRWILLQNFPRGLGSLSTGAPRRPTVSRQPGALRSGTSNHPRTFRRAHAKPHLCRQP